MSEQVDTNSKEQGNNNDDETPQNSLKNFEIIEKIGFGSFGKVYKVKDKNTGIIYAAKISKDVIKSDEQENINLEREVSIISGLIHPAIIEFICYSPVDFENKPMPVIITEYAENETLEHMIKLERESRAHERWNNTQKMITLFGIAAAMEFLHENDIIHRDLKPANILIDKYLHPKICDFGFSKIIRRNESNMTIQSTISKKGTPLYMAPEICKENHLPIYSKSVDVYAFGMILYEVITNETPLQISQNIFKKEDIEFSKDISPLFQDLIRSCLDYDYSKRPTFSDIAQQLRGDQSLRSEQFDDFDDEEYEKYVDFIDEYKVYFKKNSSTDVSKFIKNEANKFKVVTIDTENEKEQPKPKEVEQKSLRLCPKEYYNQLDEDRKSLIDDAENDPDKQCIVGQFLVEGIEGFPQETDLGIKYLNKAIESGCIEACTYYSNLLLSAQYVQYDVDLARQLLEGQLSSKDGVVYLLYGKALRKLKRFDEAKKYFKKGAKQGNSDAMYEYGKMLYRGEGGEKNDQNDEEANIYFDLAKKNGNYKAYKFVIKKKKDDERKEKVQE